MSTIQDELPHFSRPFPSPRHKFVKKNQPKIIKKSSFCDFLAKCADFLSDFWLIFGWFFSLKKISFEAHVHKFKKINQKSAKNQLIFSLIFVVTEAGADGIEAVYWLCRDGHLALWIACVPLGAWRALRSHERDPFLSHTDKNSWWRCDLTYPWVSQMVLCWCS